MTKVSSIKCSGINSELISWLRQYSMKQDVIPDNISIDTDLIPAICSKDYQTRVAYSKEVIKKLWYQHEILGPYPFLETLSMFEFDRVFYTNYRDHASHQLKVYLLGLYFFENSPLIKTSILKEINIDDEKKAIREFHIRWLVTAVYHDIGYVIENEQTDSFVSKAWETTKNVLNETLRNPLSSLAKFEKLLSKEKEKIIIKRHDIYTPQVDYPNEIEFDKDCDDYLMLLKDYGNFSKLGASKNNTVSPVRTYYDYAYKTKPIDSNRPSFRDHGIGSALLLLKVWRSFKKHIERLSQIDNEEYLSEALPSILSLNQSLKEIEKTIIAAASAISLHNISKDIWDTSSALTNGLTLNDFYLRLEQTSTKHSTPLGFLLGLVDSIQCWDRPMFTSPTINKKPISDEEINMYSSDGKIYLSFGKDTERFKSNPKDDPDSLYSKLIEGIVKYIDPKSVNKIIDSPFKNRNKKVKGTKEIKSEPIRNKVTLVPSSEFKELKRFKTKQNKELTHTLINKYNDWLVGAVNFDEDLHFSSFYLYQSWQYNLPEGLKEFGYENIIACYKDFKEIYFIPEKECQRVADVLIKKMESNPFWFSGILEKIVKLADDLIKVFPFNPDYNPFSEIPKYELADYYNKHRVAHTNLYIYSRIPEALDRGRNYFTNHLKNYLQSVHKDFTDKKTLNEVFEIFTFPEENSIAGNEFTEFIAILEKIRNNKDLRELFSGSGTSTRRIFIKADPSFVSEIKAFREKWTYWSYHGYGTRVLRDVFYFLEKFKRSIDDTTVTEKAKQYQSIFTEAERKKLEYFSIYNIDTKFQMLFRLYSKIGAVKLYRRFIQLQNFYFLDLLISEISRSYNIKEEIIRNLFPEEVESLLKGEFVISEEINKRVQSSAVIYGDSGKVVINGEDAEKVREELKKLSEEAGLKKDQLTGDPIGTHNEIIKGHCKVVQRKEDLNNIIFNFGDILVCEAADPDLYDIMKIAGAVLTEQGGVTSHASTYCRENNIKAITGIKGLLERISNNDLVEVDTNLGIVKILTIDISEIVVQPTNTTLSQGRIGNKAYNLLQLKANHYNVPNFFCIPIDSLKEILQKGTQDSVGLASQTVWDFVNKEINNLQGELFAIRSSFNNEDTADFSGAGANHSELHVAKEDTINTVIAMASQILILNTNLTGSFVIQEMVLGDVSGILFTSNVVNNNSNEVILEAIPGGNELLTEGQVSPVKYIIDKNDFSIKKASNDQVWRDLLPTEIVNKLVEISCDIESKYAKPQDIEWTISSGIIFILQSRPITFHNPDSKHSSFSKVPKPNNDIIGIYRSYRVPENLQLHMLKVASVGKWITENWQGQPIDKEDIITTLLIHDIGNLVKGIDDSFSNLFPQGYKYLPYWKAVQGWVKERYGATDIQATLKIAKEIGVSDRILFLLEKKQFANNENTFNSDDIELKICAYADQRVSPYGVVSLISRLEEAVRRYKDSPTASVNSPNRDRLIECAVGIEKQIFESIDKAPGNIYDDAIIDYMRDLRSFHFKLGSR